MQPNCFVATKPFTFQANRVTDRRSKNAAGDLAAFDIIALVVHGMPFKSSLNLVAANDRYSCVLHGFDGFLNIFGV